MISLILAFALATAPCVKTDNECLLRLTLQQTYDLEAAREENKLLNQELEEERNRSDNRAFTFIAGGLVFLGFFGGFLTLYKGLK